MPLDNSSFSDLLLKGLLLDETSIKDVDTSTCTADPNRIKYMAKIDGDLKDIIPILFLALPNSSLTRSQLILSFTIQRHNFMLGENGDVAVTYVKDEDEIDYINGKLVELINKGIRYSLTNNVKLDSLVAKKRKLTPMKLYNLFPKTDCGECGEDSCFNYAVKIIAGETGSDRCPYIEPNSIKHLVSPVDLDWSIDLTNNHRQAA